MFSGGAAGRGRNAYTFRPTSAIVGPGTLFLYVSGSRRHGAHLFMFHAGRAHALVPDDFVVGALCFSIFRRVGALWAPHFFHTFSAFLIPGQKGTFAWFKNPQP